MKTLRTAKAVVDRLGVDKVCELTEANSKQAWHWHGRSGLFPANTYCVLQSALKSRKCRALDGLWNMKGVERVKRKKARKARKSSKIRKASKGTRVTKRAA